MNDLKSRFPEIAAEWDEEKNGALAPDAVAPQSNRRAWWTCEKGHSYQAVILYYGSHYEESSCDVAINGGVFEDTLISTSGTATICGANTLKITDGKFRTGFTSNYKNSITGGLFAEQVTDYLAAGYEHISNADEATKEVSADTIP